MEEFNALIDVIERLLAPDGCPWDQEQTMHSIRGSVLEEACEVIEAINLNDNQKIEEELGDLFFNAIFLAKLAEKEGRFKLQDTLLHVTAKLIRRHPHVFGEAVVKTTEQVLKQWEEIKQTEKEGTIKNVLDGIPQELPALVRAQKISKRLKKMEFPFPTLANSEEMVLGQTLFKLAEEAQQRGLDAEQALRTYLTQLEHSFRSWENE
jgi:tetrapyrrole methylase family protein/MazG family protein